MHRDDLAQALTALLMLAISTYLSKRVVFPTIRKLLG